MYTNITYTRTLLLRSSIFFFENVNNFHSAVISFGKKYRCIVHFIRCIKNVNKIGSLSFSIPDLTICVIVWEMSIIFFKFISCKAIFFKFITREAIWKKGWRFIYIFSICKMADRVWRKDTINITLILFWFAI